MISARKGKAFSALLVILLAVTGQGPLAAEKDRELDPVVAEVVQMLEAAVDEVVILQWLESTGRRPTDIGAAGMIALTEAKASKQLIDALLGSVRPSQGDSDTAGVAEPEGAISESPSPAGLAEGARVTDDHVEAVVGLRAKRTFTEEDEPDSPRDSPWWVYLYLDGELVAWTKPSREGEPVRVRRRLSVGEHEMRVILQRYEDRLQGWWYESLSLPHLLSFDVAPGDAMDISVEMVRSWGFWQSSKAGGPLRYEILRGGVVLAQSDGAGGDPERWAPVCEDVEANFSGGGEVPKRFRSEMSRCVRWADLWNGVGKSTSRSAILAELAEYDFQPPLR